MTEKSDDEYQQLTFADCVRYLNSKNVTLKCAACGTEGSAIVTDPETRGVSIYTNRAVRLRKTDSHELLSWGRFFFQTMCTSCGCMRHFDYEKAADWIKENPEGEE